jgi:hypothetical protein
MDSMATSTQPLRAVNPTVEWLQPPIWPCRNLPHGQPGLVHINGVPYSVLCLGNPFDEDELLIAYGLRLVKSDGTVHDIEFDNFTCDCGDCTFRQRDCKHLLACQEIIRPFREEGRS